MSRRFSLVVTLCLCALLAIHGFIVNPYPRQRLHQALGSLLQPSKEGSKEDEEAAKLVQEIEQLRETAIKKLEALNQDEYLQPFDPWKNLVIQEETPEEDLLLGTRWKVALRFLKTKLSNNEQEEICFDFELEFMDQKVSDEEVQSMSTASQNLGSLGLESCREVRVKSRSMRVQKAVYYFPSELKEQMVQLEGDADDAPPFMPLIIVLQLEEGRFWIEDNQFEGPLILATIQHSMATWKPLDGDKKSELEGKLTSVFDEFNDVHKKIEETSNGFAKWGMRFQQMSMLPGLIQKGMQGLGEIGATIVAMPTQDELELSSRRDVALRKKTDYSLGDNEGNVQIEAILD